MSHKSTRLCQVGQPGIPSKVPSLPINKNSNLMRQINTHPQPSLTSQYHFHVVFVSVLRTPYNRFMPRTVHVSVI